MSKKMSIFEKDQIRCYKIMNILSDHPALGCGYFGFLNCLDFSIHKVCKRKYDESVKESGVRIYKNSKHAPRFKKEFQKELKELEKSYESKKEKNLELLELEKKFLSVDVNYEKLFGEKWSFDHVEYWGELSIKIFTGENFNDPCSKYEDWDNWAGVKASGRTFEEMVLELYKKFIKTHGKFDSESFLTEREKRSHEENDILIFKKDNVYELNKKYIRVSDSKLNRRWLQWFAKTDYAKENWKDNIKEVLKRRKK